MNKQLITYIANLIILALIVALFTVFVVRTKQELQESMSQELHTSYIKGMGNALSCHE